MDYITKEIEVEIKEKRVSDDIVDRLVEYRKLLHMTQQDIADATGIKRANVARLESKKHAVTLESLVKYANCLNLELCLELKEKSERFINAE